MTLRAAPGEPRVIAGVPLHNIWLLLLYAHDLARFVGTYDAEIESSRDLDSLIALLLADAVEHRLRRNLSRGYVEQRAVLRRVRGRIDLLRTVIGRHQERGEIACRFDAHTSDTLRNRFVRRALEDVARRLDDRQLARRCRDVARQLEKFGVGAIPHVDARSVSAQLPRHERDDEFMITLARWVYELALPTEEEGPNVIDAPDKEEALVRRLFERAVANFCRLELSSGEGWTVSPQKTLYWQEEETSGALHRFLPKMVADIVIEHRPSGRILLVETKFANLLARNRFGAERLRSSHLYQVYSYLRSQEMLPRLAREVEWRAAGLLLYPAVDCAIDEWAVFHGHRIYFATVDLAGSTESVRARLRDVVRRAF